LDSEGRFGNDDYTIITIYVDDTTKLDWLIFDFSTDLSNYYSCVVDPGTLSTGWNFLKLKKSDFSANGSPSWASITRIYITVYSTGPGVTVTCYFDDWRIVKADPDDADTHNDTGAAWDFNDGEWHVYYQEEGVGDPAYTLGQIETAASPSTEYIALYQPTQLLRGPGRVVTGDVRLRYADGEAGLFFGEMGDGAGEERGYVVVLDTANDQVKLQRVDGDGTYHDLATAVSMALDVDARYWVCLEFDASNRVNVYVADNPDVRQAPNLKFGAVVDATYNKGYVGYWTKQANARFGPISAGSPRHAHMADYAANLLPGADLGAVPTGGVILWIDSDVAPDGYARVTGYDDRVLYNVASGAGGTAGAATHSHDLALNAAWPGYAVYQSVGNDDAENRLATIQTHGGSTFYSRLYYTDSQAHLPPALKVLLCKKT
jgi:hypothetical protein